MKNKIKTVIILSFLTFGCSSKTILSESWVDYDGVSEISLGESQDVVKSSLGEPILITADDGGGNIIYLYYNYHIKKYLPNKIDGTLSDTRANHFERKTLLKFTFEDDELIGWEEDKLTMNTALPKGQNVGKSASLLSYVSILLNIITIIIVSI